MLIEQGLRQTLTQRIDPKLIQANAILQLSQLELQQVVEMELAENPALEVPEDDPCEGCELPKAVCVDCIFHKPTPSKEEMDLSVYELETPVDFTGDPDQDNDFIANIEAFVTLQDHLRTLLRTVVSEQQFDIAEYLVSNIDDSGYLSCATSEVVIALGVPEAEVEAVLALIQTFEPSGVGARDLQECLRIQLEHLEEDGRGNPVALAIVRDFWQDMVAKRSGKIARRLKVTQKDVQIAFEFIKNSLNPYPGNAFRTPWTSKPNDPTNIIKPDVIVRRTPAGYEIEVVQGEQYLLAINSNYRNAYQQLKNGGAKKFSDEEKKHIVEFVERADLFIRNINQRRRTLRLITKAIVEYQQGYLETGSKSFLRPLTRTRIARALKMHESTVSRATANKYVQLPSEEIVSFDFFFDSSVSIKDLIGEIIANEDSSNPLSDQAIAEMLQQRGLNVARRTVVKYREAQKILSSRQRRR
ncbi:MAG TPA: RNA polymerase factor sigma-54 [Armatimonadota bacterium]|nr:RNA polymerase factor sigma-54 [Armatimonadota bacterium]HPP73734.1 RNA polymerase factor sigma-54 [Armatimonadota bacterium]